MPSYTRSIKIEGRSADEIYEKIAKDIDHFLAGYGGKLGKFDINRDPAVKVVTLKSTMATAKLVCTHGSVELDANLSFLASAFKSKIDVGIDRWLAKTFKQT